jgi:hypothetical protein
MRSNNILDVQILKNAIIHDPTSTLKFGPREI